MIAQPSTNALVTKLTSHSDQGAPVSVQATVTRSVRSALILSRLFSAMTRNFDWVSVRGWTSWYAA
jgi:hypothetical protein